MRSGSVNFFEFTSRKLLKRTGITFTIPKIKKIILVKLLINQKYIFNIGKER